MRSTLLALAAGLVLGAMACGWSSGGSGTTAGHPFACGSGTCDSGTQYCSVITGGAIIDGGTNTSAGCVAFDGGHSCPPGSTATSPNQCGCYESSTGEVTITECVP